MTDVSVIIACLNGAKTLRAALDSAAQQKTTASWELLFADNGSTDASRQIFEDFAAEHPDIPARLIDASAQKGKVFALNTAIAQASGQGILFLDADDAYAPGYIERMHQALKVDPFVVSKMELDTLNDARATRIRGKALRNYPMTLGHAPHCQHAGGGTLGFRREVYDEVGPFDARFKAMEDTDFCIRAHLKGYRMQYCPEAVYHYRFRADADAIRRQTRNYSRYAVLLRQLYDPAAARMAQPGAWLSTALKIAQLRTTMWRLRRTPRNDDGVLLCRIASKLGEAEGDFAGALAFRAAPRNRGFGGLRTTLKRKAARMAAPIETRLWPSVTSVTTREPVVALTFDDGPDPDWTPKLLDLLAQYDAKATFFVIGERADRHPDLIQRMLAEGHEVGNHGWSHTSLPLLDNRKVADELERTAAVLGPGALKLMRPPYGDLDRRTNWIVRKQGYRPVMWSAAAGDWSGDTAEDMAARMLEKVRRGAIVLLHDSLHSYEDPAYLDRSAALDAVERVITARSDLRFSTVSELLEAGRVHERLWIKRPDVSYLRQLTRAADPA